MKNKITFGIVLAIVLYLLVVLLGALIFWGLGNLVINVFDINYEWTLLHGVVSELIYILLKEIFSSNKQ